MYGKEDRKSLLILLYFIWRCVTECQAQGSDGCVVGTWGPSCQGVCRCASGDSVCSPTDGTCSVGECSKGYTGAPYCQTACPVGSYGLNCSYTCHCPEEDICNHINGICSSDHCEEGWSGSGCYTRLPVFSTPPNITSTSYTTINVSWRKWDTNFDVGDPPVAQYNLEYKESSEVSWRTYDVITVPQDQTEPSLYLRTVTGLTPKTGYIFRLALARYEDGKVADFFSGPETSIIKTCTPPTQPVDEVFARQELQTDGLASISLSWKTPSPETFGCEKLDGYSVILQCTDKLCLKQEVLVQHPQDMYTFRDIKPDVSKDITIYPVNDAGLPGPSTLLFAAALNTNSQSSDKETMPTTDDDSVFIVSPDLSTADLQVLSRSENYLELFWSDTGADKYTVTATVVDSYSLRSVVNEVQQKITLTGDSITLHNLHVASQYVITVATSADVVLYQKTTWTHPSQPPVPPNPKLEFVSDQTATLSIEPLSINTGPLTSYQLVVEEILATPASLRFKRAMDFRNNSESFQGNKTYQMGRPAKLTSNIDFDNLTDFQEAQERGLNYYITVGLLSTQAAAGMEFTIGDGLDYGGYFNAPLKPETRYKLWVGILSRLDGIQKQTYANVLGTGSSEYTFMTKQTGDDKVAVLKKNITSLALGMFFFLFFLLVVGVMIYLLWKRNWVLPERLEDIKLTSRGMLLHLYKKCNKKKGTRLKDISNIEPSCVEKGEMDISRSNSACSQSALLHKSFCNGISVHEFNTYYRQVTNIKNNLGEEFQKLRFEAKAEEDSSSYVGSSAQNVHLNRSSQALPFDRNRLCLVPETDGANDYINATLVDNLQGVSYIVTQAPLPLTIPHFWRAVWDFKVSQIVMLLSLDELSDGMPCYWPVDGRVRQEGHISITLIGEESFAYHSIRSFELSRNDQNEIRYVRHFQFKHWKPSGVPRDSIRFLDFLRRCQRNTVPSDTCFVHCQCGTGRSGLFLAIKTLTDVCKKTGLIDIKTCVRSLHHERRNLVKNVSQYKFIHEAMAEFTGHEGSAIPVDELTPHYHNLTQVIQGNKLNIQREFESMIKQTHSRHAAARFLSPAKLSTNQNLLNATKPLPHYKTLFVDSYKAMNFFIVGAHPSASHISEFWNLLFSCGCHFIIRIVDNEESIHPIIPELGETKLYGLLSLTNEGIVKISEELVEHRLKCQDNGNSNKEPQEIMLLDLIWPGRMVAPSMKTMLQIGSLVKSRFISSRSKEIMVVEKPSSGNGGLVCVCLYLMEMVDSEGEVDVFRSIKHLRSQVPDAVTLEDQYRYCYKLVKEHVNSGTQTKEVERSHTEGDSKREHPPWKSPFPVHTSTPKWRHMGDMNMQWDGDACESQKSKDRQRSISSGTQTSELGISVQPMHVSPGKNSKNKSKLAKLEPEEAQNKKSEGSVQHTPPPAVGVAETSLSQRENDWREILGAASRLRRTSGGHSGKAFSPSKSAQPTPEFGGLNSKVKIEESPKSRASGLTKPHRLELKDEKVDETQFTRTPKVIFDNEITSSPSKKREHRFEKIGKALPVIGGRRW